MPVFQSQIDTRSDEYRRNREGMLAAIEEFRAADRAVQAIAEKARPRFRKRKQLMPRERIALLVDPGALDEAAGRIAALLSDPAGYQRMAVAAHRTWQDRRTYSEDFCAAAHEVAGRAK